MRKSFKIAMATEKKSVMKTSAKKQSVKKKTVAKKPATSEVTQLLPPADGAVVRMYRIGHGDCFLLAFPGKSVDEPVYVLIDCGYKPGSNTPYIGTSAKEVTAHIRQSTNGRIDVAVITHEHQDHVNGVTADHFDGIDVGETWFAWTEDPNDDLANRLRKKFKDQLIGLIDARNALAADNADDAKKVDRLLAFELGGESEILDAATLAAAKRDGGGANKISMKILKDKATKGLQYLRPHAKIWQLPNSDSVRVFPLGPPRDESLLDSLDPVGDESFRLAAADGNVSAPGFLAAAKAVATSTPRTDAPFGADYRLQLGGATKDTEFGVFFSKYYGDPTDVPGIADGETVPTNPEWRRIDKDWLLSSESLALAMNSKTNNASLVLAFELGKGGKVLLFGADAQRGNWVSWGKKSFKDGSSTVEVKELLGRTVLYKVGHHGSHNATLDGSKVSDWANISWLAADSESAREFTAMITAVRAWAETQVGWDHPLRAIKEALLEKAGGRVFQTDTDFKKMESKPGREREWEDFQSRASGERLYFDYVIKM